MRNSDIDVVGAGRVRKAKSFSFDCTRSIFVGAERVRKAKSFSFDCTRSIFPLRTRDNQIQSMNVPIAK